MGVFSSKKRKAVTLAVNCLLGAAVFTGSLLSNASVAGAAEALAKYKNGKEKTFMGYTTNTTGGMAFIMDVNGKSLTIKKK